MKNKTRFLIIIIVLTKMILTFQLVQSQTLSGRVYEGTTGLEPPNSKPIYGVTVTLYGSNEANKIGTFVISATTTDSAGWYSLPVSGAFDFYNIFEENPPGYNSDGAKSVSGTVITEDWIQYTYDQLSQTTTGNKFWDKSSVSPCAAGFSASPRTGCAPLTVNFTDQSTNAQSWYWKFPGGNPATSTQQNPTVVYSSPGSYMVSLKIVCTSGQVDSSYQSNYIVAEYCGESCEAAFDASPRQGCAPLTVNFTDQSTNAQSWYWKFPGGNPATSTQQNPTVVYSSPGSYMVSLKIVCTSGQVDSSYQSNYIVAEYCGESCEAAFDASPRQGCAPLTVNFTDQSTNAQSWYWKFPGGNPATSTQQNPTVVYSNPGIYSVSLKITCTNGQVDSLIHVDYIVAEDCVGDELDFGDAPDPGFPTLLASNGARHIIRPGFYLGSAIDPEPNGFPTPLADGDNTNGLNDEDGVSMSPFIAPGQTIPITVVASDTGVINAWIDFNINGNWADAGEHFIPSMPVYPGTNSFTMNVPMSAQFGPTYARFRFSSIRQLSYDGLAPDGEVEDYAVQITDGDDGSITIIKDANPKDNTPFMICAEFSSGFFNFVCTSLFDPLMNTWTILNPYNTDKVTETFVPGWTLTDISVTGDMDNGSSINLAIGQVDVDYDPGENIIITFKNKKEGDDELFDFGDAPDPNYPTLLANNGARHVINPNLFLGSGIDPEIDGQPNGTADGDDKNIVFPGIPFPAGDEDGVQIPPIITQGSTIQVNVVASASGVVNAWLDFNRNGSWADAGEHIIPAMPVVAGINPFSFTVPASAVVGQSYARFRLSTVRSISFDGIAPDGEVEDYAVAIQEPGEGSLKIIKDADPKDDTPFWISVVYGVMGGAAPYRDPSMNQSIMPNGPAGIYYLGESVPAGWTLTDIDVTGDADNGSSIDLNNGIVDVDLDPGEDITVTFRNKKTGEDEMFDLGDAPDGTNHFGVSMDAYPGVAANFPTVFDPATGLPQGPMHIQPRAQAFLGYRVSLEQEADVGPDEDPTNNIVPQNNRPDLDYFDDGVMLPLVLPDCDITSFDYRVTVAPTATVQNFYVNVWFDWNRDGDWEDNVQCNGVQAPEWAVQNQVITLSPGIHVLSTPAFISTHPPFSGTPPPIWMRIMITTLASDTDDGSGMPNGYPFGETEDYFFVPRITGDFEYDFGDAPDDPDAPGYPTLHANGGAYHDVIDGFHLGGLIDGETNGQPTADALGDDNIGLDDEDGVDFPTPLIPGQHATIEVFASANGILNAWIDYNVNQSWMEPDEHIFIDVPVSAGNNPLTFTVPPTAVPGPTFARFRLSRIPGLLSTGYGHGGEVEDYEVVIVEGGEGPPIKWAQPPLVHENPDVPFSPFFYGWDVRSEYDGTFVADDWFCKSARPVTDIHWWGSYTDWDSAFPPPVAPHAFHIGVWTDVPKSEETDWSHPGEMIWEWIVPRAELHERVVGDDFHPEFMSKPDSCFRYDFFIPEEQWFHQEKDSTIYWLSIAALYEEAPDSFVWGWKTREHFFHDDAVFVYDPVQPKIGDVIIKSEPIAEKWDLAFVLTTTEHFLELDFGDAPMQRYPTLFEHNGALHIIDPDVYLGQRIDPEPDGQPDHTSTGDDNDGINDDDGIQFLTPSGDGATYVEVTASRPGYLNAWMDFDNNGSWAEPDDQIFRDEFIPAGQSILKVPVPDDAAPPPIFSRFRFSTEPGLSYVGIAIDGEVEDYYAQFIIDDVKNPGAEATIPTSYYLYQNYPNPFNPGTIIRYDLPKASQVNVEIYNLLGQRIRHLVNAETQGPGFVQVVWDGFDDQGTQMVTGMYIYRLTTTDDDHVLFSVSKKMLFVK